MTVILRPALIPSAELTTKPLAAPISGTDVSRSQVAFMTEERSVISGVWEADPGVSRWDFAGHGEIIHILSGAMTIQRDGEEPEHVGAGDSVVFPIGWAGTWRVTEPLRKFYVVYK